ncbi:MAG: hypothetical protein D3920_13980 [Candidatus Electrothrix sp. AW2]|nr:hypothetical protein [Candidatus Electrothrix gigas]
MMLCPKCKNNHKKSDGTYCRCGYRFVFRPDVDSGMTDNKFTLILRKASADGRYYFTLSQLYCFYRTMKGKINLSSIMAKYILIGFLVVLIFPVSWQVVFFLIALTAFIHIIILYYREPLTEEEFRTLVNKWLSAKGTSHKMLVKPSLHEPPSAFPERDVYNYNYGVEGILIVQRQIIVDLLVRNGFHTDQRVLIFSVDGYPSYIEEQSKKLLQASPELPIYLLHDATEEGMAMRKKIKIPTSHKVVDLGMSPDQLQNFPTLKPLRLQEQGYNAPLDVLPYAALSAMGTAAIAAGIPFDEVLVSWKREGNSVGDSSVSSYG